jgi:SAM-dependent methyltransferase
LLDRVAGDLRGAGLVCDMGCGPGHVGRYMADRGAEVVGLDLSPGMIAEARRRNPAIGYLAGDMRRLPVENGAWAAIVAFYAIVHLAPEGLPGAFGEFRRTLRPGGLVVLGSTSATMSCTTTNGGSGRSVSTSSCTPPPASSRHSRLRGSVT